MIFIPAQARPKNLQLFFALQTLAENNGRVEIRKLDPHEINFVLCQVSGATTISFNVDKGWLPQNPFLKNRHEIIVVSLE